MSDSPAAAAPVPAPASVQTVHLVVPSSITERLAALEQHVGATMSDLMTHVRAEIATMRADLESVPQAVKNDIEAGFAWVRDHL